MNVHQMMQLLGLRLEDPALVKFPNSVRINVLNNAQIKAAQMLNDKYLTELEHLKTDVTLTSGVSGDLGVSVLDYNVLRGAEGILRVKVKSGLECTEIDYKKFKKYETGLLEGTVQNPLYYVFENKIYVFPTTTAAVDVYFLRMPNPIKYKFDISTYGTPSKTEFLGDADQNLSTDDDTYNGAVIYSVTQKSYHVITDYDAEGDAGGDRYFTVAPDAAASFGDDQIYFLTHSFDGLNLEYVECDLNESLHDLIVDLAEAECWTMDEKLDRREAAFNKAFTEIKVLNERYEEPEGIGTDPGKRK